MAVRDVVTHILLHVNAEAAASDESQVGNVSQKAQRIRDAVAGLDSDVRELSEAEIRDLIAERVPRNTQAAIRALEAYALHLSIQEWVARG